MHISEFIKRGGRYCACNNLSFTVEEVNIKVIVPYSENEIDNLWLSAINGIKTKPDVRYIARCSDCGKLYLSDNSRTNLQKHIENSGISIKEV